MLLSCSLSIVRAFLGGRSGNQLRIIALREARNENESSYYILTCLSLDVNKSQVTWDSFTFEILWELLIFSSLASGWNKVEQPCSRYCIPSYQK